ncbi:DUF2218 domain-containing protein [Novosphingobium piscinae]|uniref:DUF2218 domain-containing protein n=1 Tax=Novosphingobium piscinae TaxID=1507448 RepID=A0A7X1G0G8_9SPHN|nr:DUF2218 domain-containing protein [Novosphingobium piscinae]MBC2670358.1 DUF2218 domain-containing protein [Novosphingobium piscinae]
MTTHTSPGTAGTSTTSTCTIPTAHASRYVQQLCKHWSHNLAVEFDASQGRVVFPRDARGAAWADDAVVTFTARAEALDCTIAASEPGQLEGLKGAVARHLDRFAFREAPLPFDWRDAPAV